MTDYALIHNGKEYVIFDLEDSKTRLDPLGIITRKDIEIHINHDINQAITDDWSEQRVNGHGSG